VKTVTTLLVGLLVTITMVSATDKDEFEDWLTIDPTSDHDYVDEEYMCLQFANDLIKNATDAGFRDVRLVSIGNHALVFIDFLDSGFDLYEPQTDVSVFDKYRTDGKRDSFNVYKEYHTHENNMRGIYLTSEGDANRYKI